MAAYVLAHLKSTCALLVQLSMAEDTTGHAKATAQERSFTFDYVLGSNAGQQQVYENTGAVRHCEVRLAQSSQSPACPACFP